MQITEIIAGVILIIFCVVLIGVVLAQEAKGQGLSSVITGTSTMSDESRTRSKEVRQVRYTRIAGIALFVLTIAVNIFSILAK